MPNNWKKYKLSEAFNIIGGGTPKTKVEEYWNGNIPWLSVVDFNNDLRTVNQTEKSITELGLKKSSTKLLEKGQLIISARGTVGQIAQLGEPMAFNQSCYGLDGKAGILDNDYGYYVLKYMVSSIQSNAHGSVFDTITRSTFENIELPFPPLQEQRAIANILTAIDDKIELNLQQNRTLEEMAMALYKHWFVDFEFPSHLSGTLSGVEGYKSSGGEFVESELGMIPKGWEVKRLSEVVETIIDHRGKTPKKMGGDWSQISEGCFEAISAKNIKAGKIVKPETIKFLEEGLFKKWMKVPLKNKDVILTSEAPIGEFYFILNKTDYCLSQRLFGIRANPSILRPELLYCFISSKSGQQQLIGRGSGSTVQGIKQSELRKLNIIVPELNLQNNIADQVLNLFEQMRNNDEQNQTLTKLRDTLLPQLISGEVRVKDIKETVSQLL